MAVRLRKDSKSLRALVGTSVGSLPGFLLPFALSWRLHAGRLTDAYFLSFAIATFAATILSNVLEVNIIPAATAHKRTSVSALRRFVRTTTRNSLFAAALAYIPTAVVGIVIVDTRHSWTPSEKHLCIILILIFGTFILATAVTSVLAGTLYALGQFFTPTLSQGLRTLLPLCFILLTPRNTIGVIFTASLLVSGEMIRGLLLATLVKRHMRFVVGDGSPAPRSRLLEASVPVAMSMLVVSVSPLIDKIVASPLGTGSVTVLELSEKVFYVPFLAISASVVLVAGSRWASLSHTAPETLATDFMHTTKITVALSAAAVVAVCGAIAGITALAGTHFLSLHSAQFRGLVIIFMVGLPGAMVINQGARLMTALQRTRLLPLFALSSFTVNLVGDVVGAHFLGVDGIALASTLFRYVNALLYLWICGLLLKTLSVSRSDAQLSTPFLLR